jgi:glutamate carboxypeptidase
MHPFVRYATENQADIVDLIKDLVECESPTTDAAAVNRFVDLLVEKTRDIAKARTFSSERFGRHVRLEFTLPGKNKDKEKQILGIGHADTVWPLGTLRAMPFKQDNGRLWGPGVLDMKSGLAFFVFAARMLIKLDLPVNRKVALLVVSDEEAGSATSRAITEKMAAESEVVLVLEPGTGLTGKLKTARKGVGDYLVRIEGKASHAGVDFTDGASAILELARQIEMIAAFTDLKRGITVNPGVIRGGTRTNVIAAEAEAEIDIRVARAMDAAPLDRKFKALKVVDKRCRLEVSGGLNRPPMERTKAVQWIFRKARALASGLGVALEESATGGGSDGNFTAALGIPTLDGLGAVGEGAHAPNESILENRIADRIALIGALLQNL